MRKKDVLGNFYLNLKKISRIHIDFQSFGFCIYTFFPQSPLSNLYKRSPLVRKRTKHCDGYFRQFFDYPLKPRVTIS